MEFLNLNVFYMMLIPLVLLFVLLISSKNSMQRYFSKEMREILHVGDSHLSTTVRNTLFFLVLILFIIALSRPVIDKKEQNVKQSLIPIVVALDVSTSMLAQDIYPNRISLAKKKLQEIIKIAKNTTIGVVLFAKDSFILSPVTEDFLSLKFIVNNLNTQLDFVNGSNIYSTLEATKHMLADFKVKNLIVLSDGGNDNSYTEELDYAKENDIVIYSIGLGTKNGAPIPKQNGYMTNNNGDIVTVKLNESIKNLSLQSAGGYIDFTLDNSDVEAIINRINIQSKKEELNIQKVKVYTELFYYPLGLGIFLLLLALSSFPSRKKQTSSCVLFVMLFLSSAFIPTSSYAYTFNFETIEKATTQYNNKEYTKASDSYRQVNTSNESLYNLGNALYKEKKYQDAIDVYNKIVTKDTLLESKKLHNIGNSFVNLNKLKKAKESYEKSLKVKEDKETQENLDIIKKELEKNQKKKEQDKKQDNKENKDNKNDSQKENKKNKEQKNQENKKDKKSDKKKNDSSKQDKKESSKKDKQKQKDKKESKSAEQNKINKNELSDMEEKKWMKLLKDQPTPVYMQKVKTNKESNYDQNQPW